ncbi:MAG: GIY-YIG nuclease family protein [Candidatus Liptonbacteria bacterium]
MYFVYILQSLKNGRYYVGSTDNVEQRVSYHNAGRVKSTKPHRPLKLVYSESFATNREAREREGFLKKTAKARKEIFAKIENAAIV